jgi:hypothetical protein
MDLNSITYYNPIIDSPDRNYASAPGWGVTGKVDIVYKNSAFEPGPVGPSKKLALNQPSQICLNFF